MFWNKHPDADTITPRTQGKPYIAGTLLSYDGRSGYPLPNPHLSLPHYMGGWPARSFLEGWRAVIEGEDIGYQQYNEMC